MVASLRNPAEGKGFGVQTTITVDLPKGLVAANALIDTGADNEFVSYRFLLENGVKLDGEMLTPSRFIDGQLTPRYGIIDLPVTIPDAEGKEKKSSRRFNVINMVGCDLILGMDWLQLENPVIDFRAKTWRYRVGPPPKLKVTNPRRFSKISRGEVIYLVTAENVDKSEMTSRSDETAAGYGSGLPEAYREFTSVFSEVEAGLLPEGTTEHEIKLAEGTSPPHGPLYPLSSKELDVLRKYLEEMQQRGWIRESTSPAGAPVLFVRKPDGSLRLCVDYRGLNAITMKNRYPLPRIDEMLDRLVGAKYFTKLDLRDAYHRIRIRRGDEWKTAFRTRYGHFEYLVMPFGLCNAPATFQAYINQAMHGLLDVSVIVFLDDILIFSQTEEEHVDHVKAVLERLKLYRLYAKLSKCEFHRDKVKFLGFVVGRDGVEIDESRIDTIRNWPEPESYRDVQVFLGFAGFFRRFIHQYSQITAPLTELLKGSVKGKKAGRFLLTPEAREAFETLKLTFMTPPVLVHFDPEKPIMVDTDASGFAIAAILLQPSGKVPENNRRVDWHPVAYFSRKLTPTERRYEVHDQELLAIVSAFKHWRHYLESAQHAITVRTDHANLRYFFTAKRLNARQARWAELLSAYDFVISYRPGRLNTADVPSRRRDYAPSNCDEDQIGLLPSLQRKLGVGAWSTQIDRDVPIPIEADLGVGQGGPEHLVPRLSVVRAADGELSFGSTAPGMRAMLMKLQQRDAFAQDKARTCRERLGQEGNSNGWQVDSQGLLRLGQAIYVPSDAAVKQELLKIHHDDPFGGHYGVDRTLDLLRRKYYWDRMRKDVKDHVETCGVCQRVRTPRRKPYGQLASLPIPKRPMESLSLDFITGLPPAKRGQEVFDAILVIVDRYTKLATYVPTRTDIDAEGLADLFAENILWQYGRPKSIVSDRGSLFTSGFWSALCNHFCIKRKLSTAFHPQTDGQTERQNQTLEYYLRAYVNYRQDDWVRYLGFAAFTYNATKHSSTRMSPFMALYGYDPMPLQDDDWDYELPNKSAEERVQELQYIRHLLEMSLRKALDSQEKYYNQKHQPMSFAVGDKVLLSTKNLRTWRPSKKLDERYIGPFDIVDVIGKQAYKLRLPKSMGKTHPTFHVSLLKQWHQRSEGTGDPEEVQPLVIGDEEEWEVEAILGERQYRGRKLQYLVKWLGWPSYENSWVDENDLHAPELLEEYKRLISESSKKAPRKGRHRKAP